MFEHTFLLGYLLIIAVQYDFLVSVFLIFLPCTSRAFFFGSIDTWFQPAFLHEIAELFLRLQLNDHSSLYPP
jgi:hypothetical protein